MKGDPCQCGCGDTIKTDHPHAKYAAPACRRRAFERRIGYRPPRAGESVANGSEGRKRRVSRPRDGVTVYFPSPMMAEAALSALWESHVPGRTQAVEQLEKALARAKARQT